MARVGASLALALTAPLAAVLVLVACSGARQSTALGANLTRADFSRAGAKLKVMTTVAPITNIALNVGGDLVALYGLIPDGVDSHTFEPKPSDARVMAQADVIVINGASLEGNTKKMAQANLKAGARVYELAAATITSPDDPQTGFIFDFSFPREKGDPNPHLWMNPRYAGRYTTLLADWFSTADARNAARYRQNAQTFNARLDDLDQRIRQALATVPAKSRKLLTYHDSWAYFAREYGIEVIGAIQPSDFAQPSAQDVAKLIDQIKASGVPAVFGSEVYPSKVTEQIARETGARYIDKLRDDEPPGEPGTPAHTYLGMMAEDLNTMVSALGGDPAALRGFDVADHY